MVMVTEVIHLKVEVVVWLNRCILRWFHHMYQKDHPMRSMKYRDNNCYTDHSIDSTNKNYVSSMTWTREEEVMVMAVMVQPCNPKHRSTHKCIFFHSIVHYCQKYSTSNQLVRKQKDIHQTNNQSSNNRCLHRNLHQDHKFHPKYYSYSNQYYTTNTHYFEYPRERRNQHLKN